MRARSSPGTSWARKAAPALPCAVDSSVERLQVKASGLVDARHVLAVQSPVPLHRPATSANTSRSALGVAPSALHPTIGVHAPLVFDLVDTWMNRSIGGCQYHVAHPGGLSYDTFPVNAYEAEGRRPDALPAHGTHAARARSSLGGAQPQLPSRSICAGQAPSRAFFCYAARRCPGAPRRLPAGHRPLRRAARRPAFAARALAADDRAARGVAGRAHARAAALGAQPGARERRHLQACTPIRSRRRPWELDLVPMILPQQEWSGIEAAVVQRASAAERILVDVYGEQRLLRRAPAARAGLRACGFLRPCRGAKPAGEVMLLFYAADIARSPDGRWWVIDDRTQAPSAPAMRSRTASSSRARSRSSSAISRCSISRFFATLRDSLAHWAPHDRGSPLTVLLTPGPHNETYFRARLPRALPRPAAGGRRRPHGARSCVWLKTLSGLKRVHAILRRQDDVLRSARAAQRFGARRAGPRGRGARGNVLIANALGSNLLESSALGYLPRLSERLLGEPLRMPSVATWWCGEPAALEEVVKNLHRLVIKSAFPQLRGEPIFGEDLDERGRKARDPCCARARTTTWRGSWCTCRRRRCDAGSHPRLLPRSMGLRIFACASAERLCARWPRPRGERRRHARDLHAARGQQQGHLGARLRAGQHLQPPAPLDRAAGSGALRHPLEPGGRRTCSGSAATASAATRPRGSCASPWAGSATTFRATMTSARPVVLELLRHASILPARPARRQGLGRARAAITGRIASRPRRRPAATLRRGIAASRAAVARQLAHHQPPHPGLTQRRARQGFDLLGELDVAIAASAFSGLRWTT